jgi:hypothetical protein
MKKSHLSLAIFLIIIGLLMGVIFLQRGEKSPPRALAETAQPSDAPSTLILPTASTTSTISASPAPESTSTPSPVVNTSCLDNSGPIITLGGTQTQYSNTSLADFTKIDAALVVFTNGGQAPVEFGGGSQVCWHGGRILGGYPLDAAWHITHPAAGIISFDGTPGVIIENLYTASTGDGIRIRQGQNSGQSGIRLPFTVRGVWLKDIRDDCIESDWQVGALISDSLLDGCYVMFAARKRSSAIIDGSNNVWEISRVLGYLHDQTGIYRGVSPGHGMFFKWDSTSPKIKIYDTILRVDSAVSFSNNQFNFYPDRLIDCANNTLVWLGDGDFPGVLPSCFTLTTDKAVWDNAVAGWKTRHGFSP